MSPQGIWAIAIAVIGSTGLWSFLTAFFQTRRSHQSAQANALRSLLFDRIKCLCTHALEEGSITIDEYQNISQLYDSYHDGLNGNGLIQKLWESVQELPIVDKKKKGGK